MIRTADWDLLRDSLLVTLMTTLEGFALALAGGVGLAILFNQSRLLEYSLYPYAVILQVTPIVAIAPLLLIYLPQPVAVLSCAWIVSFVSGPSLGRAWLIKATTSMIKDHRALSGKFADSWQTGVRGCNRSTWRYRCLTPSLFRTIVSAAGCWRKQCCRPAANSAFRFL